MHSLYTHIAAAVAKIEAIVEKLIPALSPKPIELCTGIGRGRRHEALCRNLTPSRWWHCWLQR